MPEYIKDTECSRDTPVIWGKLSDRSYGTGKRIKPNIDGKHATDYEKKIYLPELLPLEEYDLVIVLFSGGKDSTAAYFKLLELGVPKTRSSYGTMTLTERTKSAAWTGLVLRNM